MAWELNKKDRALQVKVDGQLAAANTTASIRFMKLRWQVLVWPFSLMIWCCPMCSQAISALCGKIGSRLVLASISIIPTGVIRDG